MIQSTFTLGGNYTTRIMSVTGLSRALQFVDPASRSLGNQPSVLSIGGRISGPIRLHSSSYNFSAQFDRRSYPLRNLLNTDAAGLATLGVAQDSVEGVREALSYLGIPFTVARVPRSSGVRSGRLLGGVRFEPPLGRAGSLSLTVAADWREQAPASSSLLEAPSHSGRTVNGGWSLGGNHGILLRNTVFVATTVGVARRETSAQPYLALPEARVRVSSLLPDGTSAVRSLRVGGNSLLNSRASSTSFQLDNGLTWLSREGKHAFRVGANYQRVWAREDSRPNDRGSFDFGSIGDFRAGQPTSFTRMVGHRPVSWQSHFL
jgi:hypothetical protein